MEASSLLLLLLRWLHDHGKGHATNHHGAQFALQLLLTKGAFFTIGQTTYYLLLLTIRKRDRIFWDQGYLWMEMGISLLLFLSALLYFAQKYRLSLQFFDALRMWVNVTIIKYHT